MASKDAEINSDVQPGAASGRGDADSEPLQGSFDSELAEARASLARMRKHMQTPIALMELSLQLLATDQEGLCPDQRAALRDAVRAGRRIRQYVDHWLMSDAGRGVAKHSWRRRIDLGAVVRMLAEDYARDAADAGKSITVEVDAPSPSVRADEVALEHALQHALESALIHLRGRRIHIHVRAGSVAEVEFCVDDRSTNARSRCARSQGC
jgi:signal transduction histidine kinase